MKNKAEREQFLKNYKEWEKLDSYPLLGLEFYRHVFRNGATVIVTEYQRARGDGTQYTVSKYHLILLEDDGYDPFGMNSGHAPSEFLTYTLEGCGITTIVDYMTKKRDEV